MRQTFDVVRLNGGFGYISGHGPVDGTTVLMHGTVGAELAVEDLQGPALTRVADGFSDVINHIFEKRGAHARATVGATGLAFGVPTIIEGLVAV